MEPFRIGIRPSVGVLSVLSHLNYRPWFAIAEFVDNSLQSFLANQQRIVAIDGKETTLNVGINLNPSNGGLLSVRDNAAGIYEAEFARAFRPAEAPLDRSGLSEFGMGMKSAACWFAPMWIVRTSALGETTEKTIRFDVERIVEDKIEELDVKVRQQQSHIHYTEIVLQNLHKVPRTSTIGKIKTHLASIYRVFIRDGILKLSFNGETLTYNPPQTLTAPDYRNEGSESVVWRKEIDFDFGDDLNAKGFAAIRQVGSTSEAGFALFRRNRLIQGSADEGYRPELIFKKSNSFIYQRLFGELHLEGFSVSHTKDGFQWDEQEEPFLELLKEVLDEEPLALLKQAEGYRALRQKSELMKGAESSAERTARTVEENVPPIVEEQQQTPPETSPPPENLPTPDESLAKRTISIEVDGQAWEVYIELVNDPAIGDWLELGQSLITRELRTVEIRISLAHPFMVQFCGTAAEQIEPLLRLGVAIALAEVTARDSGIRQAGTFRRNVNQLLRDALSEV